MKSTTRDVFHGNALGLIQSTDQAGDIVVKVKSDGLIEDLATIQVIDDN